MGKNSQFKPATDIDDVPDAVLNYPLSPGDSRYTDCSKMRGCDTLKKIERMLKRKKKGYLHLLFTGYRGTGKTTELYQLQDRFQKDYEVFYYDATRELDLTNCKLTDILMAIAKGIHEHMKTAGCPLPEKILQDVADWFFEKVLEKEKSIAAEVGGKTEISSPKWFSFITAKIFSSVKLDTQKREIMRRKLESNLPGLIEKINALLEVAEIQLKARGKKGLIFMMDSLDRLLKGLDRELFIASGSIFKMLNANFVFVVPISLLFDERTTLLDFERVILPMIPVFEKGKEHILHEKNIEELKKLIGKRIVVDCIFTHPEKTLKKLIKASGGHLRDLLKLIYDSCNETDDRIQPNHAEIAMNQLMENYARVIQDDQYQHLVNIYRYQTTHNDAISQKLIYNNVILVYQQEDNKEWKDVHPVVVRNEKFQKALKRFKGS